VTGEDGAREPVPVVGCPAEHAAAGCDENQPSYRVRMTSGMQQRDRATGGMREHVDRVER